MINRQKKTYIFKNRTYTGSDLGVTEEICRKEFCSNLNLLCSKIFSSFNTYFKTFKEKTELSIALVLRHMYLPEFSKRHVKTQIMGLNSRISNSVCLGRDMGVCISNKISVDFVAAGLGTIP